MLPTLLTTLALLMTAGPPVQHHAAAAPPAASRGDTARVTRVRLATGVFLDVAEYGRKDGAPVVFLHGFPDSRISFSPVMPHLPPDIRAIVPSMRGHGDSDHPPCCYRLTDFAADVVGLLDALGLERAPLVGHSFGSFIAQRVAINHPERVSHLVLIGSAQSPRSTAVLEFSELAKTLTDPISPALIREFQQSTIAQSVEPSFFERAMTESGKIPARVWRDVGALLASNPTMGDLRRVRAPTLLVWGTKDALFDRAEQDSLLRAIGNARLLPYNNAGHSLNWEEPARLARDLVAFLAEPAATASGPERAGGTSHDHDKAPATGSMPLLDGLGDLHMAVTTNSPDAQRYFDQGLRLMYAFNHDEAARSFERAIQFDSTCALCHWGVAYALGPNINLPMDPGSEPRAVAAIGRAAQLRGRATARERALIDAMAVRYGEPAGAKRAARDSAFATSMRGVARRFPGDADVQVLFADAMLNLRPWNQWTRDGAPQPGTLELVGALERVLRKSPGHVGACHFYIHAIEASETPERALACAERLPKLMPGAGHVVHMPAHVYLRVGRYEDAARANIAAVEADGRYFATREVPEGIYPLFYAPHNLHFLWATYLLSGQRGKALGAARALRDRVKPEEARAVASLEGFLVSEGLTLARFGDWDAVLALPAPPPELRYSRGMWHYVRGFAAAVRGNLAMATTELDSVRAITAGVPDDVIVILNPARRLLDLAAQVLTATISARQGNFDVAIAGLRAAARLEDELTYDEPPPWYHSVRNLLGETLLDAGRAADAEVAFREDLRYVRETGWSLSGLQRALQRQAKHDEAAAIARRLQTAWKYADGPVTRGR